MRQCANAMAQMMIVDLRILRIRARLLAQHTHMIVAAMSASTLSQLPPIFWSHPPKPIAAPFICVKPKNPSLDSKKLGSTTAPPNIPSRRLSAPCRFCALKNIQAILTKLKVTSQHTMV